MKRSYFLVFIIFSICFFHFSFAQTSNEFWFAPPEVTSGHGAAGTHGLRLVMATGATAATVTIEQPANLAFNGGTPIVINIPANSGHIEDMTPHTADLETAPQDVVLNTGLHISSTANITCYYEVTTPLNPDIFALKGANGLGTEFYTPFQNTWANGVYTPPAYTSFDIVATVDNTTVLIYPRVPLDGGHPALASYSITLNRGQTYSGAVTGGVGADNPAGTAIVSDQPIAVSIKDDSVNPAPAGCRDLNGDQIVPVDIVGNEYIVTKGGLTTPEYAYIVSTANNNVINVAGVNVATLFAGETFRVTINNPSTYITCSQPAYVYHVSGFGCETGGALLPPLNCAGSSQVNVVRSTTEFFGLNIVVQAGNEGNFQLNGNPALIPAAAFAPVPNTGGLWLAAQINYNTVDVPVGTNNLITNSTDVFSVGLINGGASTGTRFGYFSEFSGKIFVNAGADIIVCANDSAQLNGSVTGGATTGIWTSNGSGTFVPNNTTLNAKYVPSNGDILAGNVTLTLASTSICFPETDQVNITFTPAPTVNAGVDQTVCGNNPAVSLGGTVTIATGGVWSGGAGSFAPNAAALNATYTPTAGEISSGSLTLYLTTTGNGTCYPEVDSMVVTFGPAPTANAGVNQSVCENNPNATLAGLVTIATGGVWSGGAGTFSPNNTSLNTTYTPTAGEITSGNVTLTLTTTGNGNCNAVSDNILITFTPSPTANAGANQTVCANNSNVSLNGSVTGVTGGSWSGGLGNFSPNNTTLNATYSPTAAEIAAGTVNLTLTTTGNGNCSAVTDNMTITITPAPTVNAGADQTVCGNNALVTLNGSVTIASGGIWSGGTGTFTPNNTTLNATYMPSAAEITAGTVTLTLTTTGNGSCNSETDNMTITITPAPQVNAGANQTLCANNASATLSGVVSGATGGFWSGGTGSFNPSATALNAIYTPSATEISNGSVILTLTSTGNGLCNAVSDNVQLTFTLPPTANAGADQTLCSNNAAISLNGSVAIATGGVWSGGLGVFTPNNNTLNATYNPTAGEIASGSVTLTLTTTGNGNCASTSDNMTVFFTTSPTVEAGVNQTVCANNPTITLNGSLTISSGAVWTGGSGTFSPNNTTLNATYTPSAAEVTAGSVVLYLTTTGNGNCLAVTDSMTLTITPIPTANAGANLTSCSNNPTVTLNGSVTGATGGIWSGGTGSFNPSNASLGATYTPSAGEITAGTVTLTLTTTGNGNCNAVSDNMTITITPPPTANAGADQTVCANNANVTLNGSVNLASGGQWTGGLGIFTPSNTALNAIYTPTSGEIASGSLTLTLTTTGNGNCNPEADQMVITFTPAPTVSAGVDQSVCANNATATLNGAVSIATGAQWSGGLGAFAPNNTTLNATYMPTASEIANGSVMLYLTSTGNGNCLSVVDSMLLTITPEPVVNAGPDQTICVNNLSVNLSGSVSGPTSTGVWTTSGTGVFVPSNTNLNAVYQASAQDSIAGTVTLTLTSTNNGNCNAVFDDMVITILPAGGANVGADQSVCANNVNVSLTGIITGNASGGVWSTSGTGAFSPNNTNLNVTYLPSAADIASGSVIITLTANSCNNATDDMIITITPAPVVNAGNDTTVCVSNLNVPLNGSVSGASNTGSWSTSGTGTFTPNNTTLNATYNASAADSVNQGVVLYLTATNIGNCAPVTDTVVINLFPTGTANAGADQTVCANNATITLNGSITGGATSGQWTTSGSGTFVPSDTVLNATYIPSSADTAAGSVNLVLNATNSCSPAADFMVLTITPAPVVEAGPDQVVCGTNATFSLNGSVSGPTTTGIWSTSGTGTFSNNTIMNPTYTASATDISNGGVTIYLTSTNNGLCNPVVDSLLISITTGIGVNAGPDQSVCLTSTQTQLMGAVFNGSTTGQWTTTGTGTFFPHDSVMSPIYQITSADTTAGTIMFILTSTNNGNCSPASDTMVVTFGSAAYANAGVDQTICADNLNVPLNGVVSGGSSSGIWTTNGTGTFNPSDTVLTTSYLASATDSAAGSVDIYLTTTNNDGGCSSGNDTITINFDYVPIANAGTDQTICTTVDSVYLNGNVQYATGGTWTTSGTGTFVPNNTDLNAVYVMSAADITNGSVQVMLTTISGTTCSDRADTMTITVNNPLTVDFSFSGQCVGQAINFYDSTVVASGSILSWEWNFGDGGFGFVQNPTHTYLSDGNYTITLVVTTTTGCKDSISQSITINPLPIADFSFGLPPFYVGVDVNINDQSSGANSWNWDFGDDLGTSNIQNPVYNYTVPGVYVITQYVTSAAGCVDSTSKEIKIEEDNVIIYPPNFPTAFTPNGDGNNDVFFVRGGPFVYVNFRIYNEWGEMIFSSNDAENGWNGTHNGEEVPVGTYVYTIKAETIDGLKYDKSGKIALIR
ncbi:MAG: PKD domain-containing protein [Flavobacteriales bacterium]|nr:PKD domain-containing protein [Flavobacteriales bacterium]MCW8913562.1 PKD domain-containing protein [Flavobacteriales bacterium]MCW8967882.1 PKD domain-containing protein [Flavobacteriales bacterium]MCW8990635.1 PKD domain-containing protein [Flavobacteriales bacterium]